MTTNNQEISGGAPTPGGAPGGTTGPADAEAQAEWAAAEHDAAQAAAAKAAITALGDALASRAAPPPAGGDARKYAEKWPDYLLQWRSSLWVSMREKESNVWKFVAFYATAITLIIGLGQRIGTTQTTAGVDLPVDVSAVAAVVGLLTFWGLGIVIDSNFWMSRNLKLVGNIEKLFFQLNEYGTLIPGSYASPLFRYARPYSINFFFLVVLGCIAYLNFVVTFPPGGAGWRQYLLPCMTLLYVGGFHAVQALDDSTRNDYFRFYRDAKGKEIAIGSENMPPEHLEFKTAAGARFQRWSLSGGVFVALCYAFREWFLTRERWLWWPISLLFLTVLFHVFMWWRYATLLKKIEKKYAGQKVKWDDLKTEQFTRRRNYEKIKDRWTCAPAIVRWVILVITSLTVAIATWPWLRAIAVGGGGTRT